MRENLVSRIEAEINNLRTQLLDRNFYEVPSNALEELQTWAKAMRDSLEQLDLPAEVKRLCCWWISH